MSKKNFPLTALGLELYFSPSNEESCVSDTATRVAQEKIQLIGQECGQSFELCPKAGTHGA